MSFPIKAKDLEKNQASNDEEALFIAVEALLNDEFEKLAFSKNTNVIELKNNILNDPRFEEVHGLIGYEKTLLTSIVAKNEIENDISKLMALQNKTLEALEEDKPSGHSSYAKLSVAASVIIITLISVLGASYIINKNSETTATKSNSDELIINQEKSLDKSSKGANNADNPGVVSREEPTSEQDTQDPEIKTNIDSVSPSSNSSGGVGVDSYTASTTNNESFVSKHSKKIIEGLFFLIVLVVILFFRTAFKKSEDSK